jgi:RNA polymerase sigma-70 factor (ECF subfamily)
MLGNSKAAEDAAQESFIRAYRNLKRYDPNRSFATWLLSIASHYCIDQMRKRRLDTVSTDALPAEIIADRHAPNPEREIRSREKEALIQDLLKELNPTDRARDRRNPQFECQRCQKSAIPCPPGPGQELYGGGKPLNGE